jgi:hypothetical protein
MMAHWTESYSEALLKTPEYAIVCIVIGLILLILGLTFWFRAFGNSGNQLPTGVSGLLFLLAAFGFFGFALIEIYVPTIFLVVAAGWHAYIMYSRPGKGIFLQTSREYEQREALSVFFHEMEIKGDSLKTLSPLYVKSEIEANLSHYGLCNIDLRVIDKGLRDYHRRKEYEISQGQRDAVALCIQEFLAKGVKPEALSPQAIKQAIESNNEFYGVTIIDNRFIKAGIDEVLTRQSGSTFLKDTSSSPGSATEF